MNTQTVDIHDAQVHLLELLALVSAGNEVMITQAQKPVMRLVPVENGEKERIAGLHAGMGWISDDFDASLPGKFWAKVESMPVISRDGNFSAYPVAVEW